MSSDRWCLKRVKDIARINYGRELSDNVSGNIPVYGSGGVFRYTHTPNTSSPVLVIGRKGLAGSLLYLDKYCYCIDTVFFIDTTITNEPIKWLYYYFNTLDLSIKTIGVGPPGISRENIYSRYLLVPPLSKQQAIANFLDTKLKQIDSYIKQKQKMLGLLENQKTAIINNEIPGNFELRKLKNITLKIGSGSTPLGGEKVYIDSGVILLRSQNIGWSDIITDNLVYISDEIDSQMSQTRVMAGDILLNITGISSIGRCCIVPQGFPRANVNQHVCIIRPDPRCISSEYLIKVFLSEYIQSQIRLHSTGATTKKGLDFERVGNFLVPVPGFKKQQAITNFLNTKTSRINNYLKSKSSELTNLADSKTHLYNSINNDYKTTRLKYVATVISGKSLSNKPVLNNPQPVNVVSFKHVLDDNIITSGLQSGNVSSEFLVKNKLEYNDVLITGEGDYHLLGRSGLFKNKANSYVAGAGVYVIKVNQELVDPDFLAIYIRTSICKNYFSTHNLAFHYPPRISLTDLKNLPVPLIPLPDQKQIATSIKTKISKINSCINLIQSQIKLMEEYRKSLIFEAVTGKLDI